MWRKMMLNRSPTRGPFTHLKSQTETVLGLLWELILILLVAIWQEMSLIEKKSFLWRAMMAAFLINGVYLWVSILFYYGTLPSWIDDALGSWIIQPFRRTLSLNSIGWAVSLGTGVNETVMTTPLFSVTSWDHYLAVLVSICVAVAFLTEPKLWKRIGAYVNHVFRTKPKQSTLDSYFRAKVLH